MANHNPVVLVHGYSDQGRSFEPWAKVLRSGGYEVVDINVVTYESLTNEVTIKDIAEAFDRALRAHPGLRDPNQPFDAIVHSTGMLVVRAWLTSKASSAQRRKRLKHLIGFAPATFGSPLAHKGRGWLGAAIKGNKHLGPDFLEAGDLVLDALELASRFTWDLAHIDLFAEQPFYGTDADSPYPFVFVGNRTYEGLLRKEFVNQPGTDGTVRWSGVSLDSRKVTVDLTIPPGGNVQRIRIGDWTGRVDVPVVFVNGRNHGSILSDPEPGMQELVLGALAVRSNESFIEWSERAKKFSQANVPAKQQFQQFVVRVIDERGDPVSDYNLALYTKADDGHVAFLDAFELDVHPYARDMSYRCFHADLAQLFAMKLKNLWMQLTLSSGTILVGYRGFSTVAPPKEVIPPGETAEQREKRLMREDKRPTEVNIDLTARLSGDKFQFFYPFTTTVVEIVIDREPLPVDDLVRLCRFIQLELT